MGKRIEREHFGSNGGFSPFPGDFSPASGHRNGDFPPFWLKHRVNEGEAKPLRHLCLRGQCRWSAGQVGVSPTLVVEAPTSVGGPPTLVVEAPTSVVGPPTLVVEAPTSVVGSPTVVVETPTSVEGLPTVVVEAPTRSLPRRRRSFGGRLWSLPR